MDIQKKEEYISIAYLRAIAADAGINFSIDPEDGDSVDVHLKKHIDDLNFDSTIGIQLKATSSSNYYREDENNVYYHLKVKNYNDLRRCSSETKYLALLILPQNEEEWISQNIEELIIRRNMYWISLFGYEEVDNKNTIVITIPKKNIINKDSLLQLINKEVEGVI